jgi:hypothetical protein
METPLKAGFSLELCVAGFRSGANKSEMEALMATYDPNDRKRNSVGMPASGQYFLVAAIAVFAVVIGLALFGPDEPNQRSADNQPAVTGPGQTSKQPTAPTP